MKNFSNLALSRTGDIKCLLLIILVFPTAFIFGYPVAGYLLLPIFLSYIFFIRKYKLIKYKTYHGLAFAALISFLLFSVILSIYSIQDFRLLIFIPFFLSIFALDKFLLSHVSFDEKFYNLFIKYGFYYAIFYLIFGLIAWLKYQDIHAFQGVYFAGSSVAVLPIFFVLIFVPYLINAAYISRKYLYLFLISSIIVAIVYQSRTLIFTMFATTFFMVFFNKKFKGNVLLLFLCLNVPVFLLPSDGDRNEFLLGNFIPIHTQVDKSGSVQYGLKNSDLGRLKSVSISTDALFDTSPLIGNGFYSGRVLMKPFYIRERPDSKIIDTLNDSPLQLASLPALIFDLGIIGCFLLIINLSLVFLRLMGQLSLIKKAHLLFVLSLFMGFSYVGSGYILPMFYIFMMPSFVRFFSPLAKC